MRQPLLENFKKESQPSRLVLLGISLAVFFFCFHHSYARGEVPVGSDEWQEIKSYNIEVPETCILLDTEDHVANLNMFTIESTLGMGADGHVLLVKGSTTGKPYALKFTIMQALPEQGKEWLSRPLKEALVYQLTDVAYPLTARFYNGWIGNAKEIIEYITAGGETLHPKFAQLTKKDVPVNCMIIEHITGESIREAFENIPRPSKNLQLSYALQFVFAKAILEDQLGFDWVDANHENRMLQPISAIPSVAGPNGDLPMPTDICFFNHSSTASIEFCINCGTELIVGDNGPLISKMIDYGFAFIHGGYNFPLTPDTPPIAGPQNKKGMTGVFAEDNDYVNIRGSIGGDLGLADADNLPLVKGPVSWGEGMMKYLSYINSARFDSFRKKVKDCKNRNAAAQKAGQPLPCVFFTFPGAKLSRSVRLN